MKWFLISQYRIVSIYDEQQIYFSKTKYESLYYCQKESNGSGCFLDKMVGNIQPVQTSGRTRKKYLTKHCVDPTIHRSGMTRGVLLKKIITQSS